MGKQIFIILFVFVIRTAFSQCNVANTRTATSTSNVNGGVCPDASAGTVVWSSNANAVSSNDLYASRSLANNKCTAYLTFNETGRASFGASDCIGGFVVRIERYASDVFIYDYEVKLFNATTTTYSSDKSSGTAWSTTEGYVTYGASNDIWGYGSITATDWNHASSGPRVRAKASGGTATAYIDHLEFTMYADVGLPVQFLRFDAIKCEEKNNVMLEWEVASEINNDYYTIERSRDGETNWEHVTTKKGAGNSSSKLYYMCIDEEPFPGRSYYRLKQRDFDGTETVLDRVFVNFRNDKDKIWVYPNPGNGIVTLRSYADITNTLIEVTDAYGRIVKQLQVSDASTEIYSSYIDLTDLAKGVYQVSVTDGVRIQNTKMVVQ